MSEPFLFKGQPAEQMVILVRHGQSAANAAHGLPGSRVQGSGINIPLSSKGKKEARTFAGPLNRFCKRHNVQIARVHCSSARRAVESRNLCLKTAKITPLILPATPLLLEINKGNWEGQEHSRVYTPYNLERAAKDWHFRHGTGETAFKAGQRWLAWFEQISSSTSQTRLPHAELVFGHNGITRFGLYLLLNKHSQNSLPPLEASRIYRVQNCMALVLIRQKNRWHVDAERIKLD